MLQPAFRRHLDTTPMAYLRRLPLETARDELASRGPGDTTVTAVAARWGFASASTFAARYRDAFGEPPSHALAR